jgi:hypothetical protein
MNEGYPVPVQTIVQTLGELLSHRGEDEISDMVRQAEASIDWTEHDNWNGGTEYYVMNLRVPVAAYASIEPRREAIEKLLLEKTSGITRQFDRNIIREVVITPDSRLSGQAGTAQLSPEVLKRIWEGGGLRLFLSHVSQLKVAASNLKGKLVPYGGSAFVAHEDIEPNLVWEAEIARALASMHALVAMVTPGFDNSVWCQQEIGFALGRGVPVIPLRLGADPRGFIGRIQAASGDPSKAEPLASAIVDLLIKHPRTTASVRECLVAEFEQVWSWENAKLLNGKIVTISGFDEAQLDRLERALTANQKVAEAWGVPDAIRRLLAAHRSPTGSSS